MANNGREIVVFYRGPESLGEVKYAYDLAGKVRGNLIVLLDNKVAEEDLVVDVLSPGNSQDRVKTRSALHHKTIGRVALVICDVIGKEADFDLRFEDKEMTFLNDPSSAIVVGNEYARSSRNVTAIAPWIESAVFGRGMGEVMIPIGKRGSGRFAIKEGLPLVKEVSPQAKILFWHVTWQDPNVKDEDPNLHVSPMSRDNLAFAKSEADRLNIPSRTLVEMRRDVVEGMSRVALREGCSLVVMARGLNTVSGRYGDQLLKRTCPVPIVMLRLEGRPSW